MVATTQLELLITVKAYPQIGRRSGEAVCVAAIRTDEGKREWARLFPVPFRDLEKDVQFAKYQYITVKAVRPRNDRRPESWTPHVHTLRLGETIPPGNKGWPRRRDVVDPVVIDSMCELRRRQEMDGTSLGAFRPADVDDVLVRTAQPWDQGKKSAAAQANLLNPEKTPLEQTPYEFSYRYKCADAACGGHTQTIIDWEIGQAWRKFGGGSQERVDAIRRKWLEELCASTRDTIFFVGNMHQHPGSFLILGVFWPPKSVYTPSLFV